VVCVDPQRQGGPPGTVKGPDAGGGQCSSEDFQRYVGMPLRACLRRGRDGTFLALIQPPKPGRDAPRADGWPRVVSNISAGDAY
jgi:hypothetical protein